MAATANKNLLGAALKGWARPLMRVIQADPAVTDDQRQSMGLAIPDRTPTRAAVSATRPLVWGESPEHLRHVVHWRDEATPKSKAKPKGVRGAQIRLHVGPNPPAELEEFEWVALESATPCWRAFEAANGGKTAYYALRWENTRGETGPSRDVVSATILA